MSFTIIIPAKNEEENLRVLFPRILTLYPEAEILLVDGGSSDKTLSLCKDFGITFIKENGDKKGKAVAMRQGALLAKNDSIIFFDADCSHDPNDIKKIIAPIINNDYLHVSGSRTLGGSSELFNGFSHFIRLIGSIVINKMISHVFRFEITDAQNGLRAFNKKFFLSLKSKSIHTTIEQELVCLTLWEGEPILEIPTHEYKRLYGDSKISLIKHGPSYFFQMIFLLFFSGFKKIKIKNPKKIKYNFFWWLI